MLRKLLLAFVAAAATLAGNTYAFAQTEPFLGQIAVFGFSFCPPGWTPASGQLLPVNSANTAMFSLLGTTYGGDGRTNFALPNLNGNMIIGSGATKVGTRYTWGQSGGSVMASGPATGSVSFTLSAANLPPHTHQLMATSAAPPAGNSPAGALLPTYGPAAKTYSATTAAADTPMSTSAIKPTGSGQPVTLPLSLQVSNISTQNPYVAMTVCIAVEGIYPSRPQ
jgi:microcystin-dependent protein